MKFNIYNKRYFIATVEAPNKQQAIVIAADQKRAQGINPDSVIAKWEAKPACERFISWEEEAYQNLNLRQLAQDHGLIDHIQSVTHGYNVTAEILTLIESQGIKTKESPINYCVF